MPKVQIKHAAARYTDGAGQTVVAHRGDVIDLSDAEAKRLAAIGAITGEDEELTQPGDLLPLQDEATEDQIENYLVSGTTQEILDQVDDYPASLVEKLIVAERNGRVRTSLLEGLTRRVGSGTAAAAKKASIPTPDEDLGGFVEAANAPAILKYVGEDVEKAQLVLEVENGQDKPRKGLVEALTKLIEG